MMTTAKPINTRSASTFATIAQALRGVARFLADSWTNYQNRRRIRALDELDDYLLADMGLTRADLIDAYATPIHRDPSLRLAASVAQRDPVGRPRGKRGDGAMPDLKRRLL